MSKTKEIDIGHGVVAANGPNIEDAARACMRAASDNWERVVDAKRLNRPLDEYDTTAWNAACLELANLILRSLIASPKETQASVRKEATQLKKVMP